MSDDKQSELPGTEGPTRKPFAQIMGEFAAGYAALSQLAEVTQTASGELLLTAVQAELVERALTEARSSTGLIRTVLSASLYEAHIAARQVSK